MTYINCSSQPLETINNLVTIVRGIKAEVYGASANPRIRTNSRWMRIHLVGLHAGRNKDQFISKIEAECGKFRQLPARRKNESDEHLNGRGWQPTVVVE